MRVSTKIIQKCQVSDKRFSKEWFIKQITNLGQDEFDRFCREVMLLNEHYDSTMGLHCTDVPDKVEDPYSLLYRLDEIDFDSPITFRVKQDPPEED